VHLWVLARILLSILSHPGITPDTVEQGESGAIGMVTEVM